MRMYHDGLTHHLPVSFGPMNRRDEPDLMPLPTDQHPARRWGVRHLMGLVVVVAGLLWVYRVWPSVVNFFNDDPHHAFRMVNQTWNLGPEPRITVDLFEGSLQVLPSGDGQVHAQITAHTWTKDLQAVADAALDSIVLGLDHVGDTLRITARGASEIRMNGISMEAGVVLHVPTNVRLDLRTGRGRIIVGHDYTGSAANRTKVHLPLVAYSIRVRNDSKYRVGFNEGDIVVEATAPRPAGLDPIPTRLQLEAPGQIDIRADLATLEAWAWHTISPHTHTARAEPEDGEGSVHFTGRLAPGTHSVRAAHDIALLIPATDPIEIHARATKGSIQGNLLPAPIPPTNGQTRWDGSIGTGAGSTLNLQTDSGSIDLNKPRG